MKKKPMKRPSQATVIDRSLPVLRIAELAARGDRRTFGRKRHRSSRVLRGDIVGVPMADVLAALRVALKAIREGQNPDEALGITRKRGTSKKSNLYSRALQVHAWRAQKKTRPEIEQLARQNAIHLSPDRLHKLPTEFTTEIEQHYRLKALLESNAPPPIGNVKLVDRKSGAVPDSLAKQGPRTKPCDIWSR